VPDDDCGNDETIQPVGSAARDCTVDADLRHFRHARGTVTAQRSLGELGAPSCGSHALPTVHAVVQRTFRSRSTLHRCSDEFEVLGGRQSD